MALQGVMRIIIPKVLGKEIKLRSERDLVFVCKLMREQGVYLSPNSLRETIHFILNSLEDGRIEGIRGRLHPGFVKYTKMYRYKQWTKNPVGVINPATMTADNQLVIVLNQILTLATMQVWQKGFVNQFLDTNIYNRCQELIPMIAEAISAPTCKECMQVGVKICAEIADLILAAAQCKSQKMNQLIEELVRRWLANEDSLGDYSFGGNTEETGEGTMPNPVTGKSALVVELDDDKFDELEKKSKEGKIDGVPSVIFKRKHPKKPDKEEAEENSGSPATGSDGETSESENTSSKSASKAGTKGGNSGSSGSGSTTADDSEKAQGAKKESSSTRKAAEQSAKTFHKFANSPKTSNPSPSDLFDPKQLAEVYKEEGNIELLEERNQFPLNRMLPFPVRNRAEKLKRELETKLQSKQLPKRRGQRAGSIDSSRIANLAMRDMAVFKSRQKSQKPDVAVYLLKDNSGSMEGEKNTAALEASAVMEEAFKSLCPIRIVAFDAFSSNKVRHIQIKDWQQKGTANLSYNFLASQPIGYGNKDGYSIRVATSELLKRPEKNKLLLVLSDGMPTEYTNGFASGIEDTKNALDEAKKAGLSVFGIFFSEEGEKKQEREKQERMFRFMYGPQSVCTTSEGLEDELLRVMTRFFFR
jgi:nitric oxide reductase activation protein